MSTKQYEAKLDALETCVDKCDSLLLDVQSIQDLFVPEGSDYRTACLKKAYSCLLGAVIALKAANPNKATPKSFN